MTKPVINSIEIIELANPLTMESIEYYENGKVKSIKYRNAADVLKAYEYMGDKPEKFINPIMTTLGDWKP